MVDLPAGASVGTSSLRRQCQLLAVRPDLSVISLRGNVDTRVRKLEAGEYDAVILAIAGLQRLGLEEKIDGELAAPSWLPAPCQGAIGLQCRSEDQRISALIHELNHTPSQQQVEAEQSLSRLLGGSCQLPLAAYAELHEHRMTLHGMVGSSDGKAVIRASATSDRDDPEGAANDAAHDLRAQGADDIIRAELARAPL